MKGVKRVGSLIIDVLSVGCAVLMVYDFFLILTKEEITPLPDNFAAYVALSVAISCLLLVRFWRIFSFTYGSVKSIIVQLVYLFSVGGVVAGYVILPIPFILDNDLGFYSALEPNMAILIFEFVLFTVLSSIGIAGVFHELATIKSKR